MGVEDARERHPAARELDLDQGVGRQIETEAAVLLGDRHAEEAHVLHLRDERRRVLVGVLELGRDRDDVLLDPFANGRDDLAPLGFQRRRHYAATSRGEREASSARRSRFRSRLEIALLDGLDCDVVERERRIVPELLPHLRVAQRVLRRARLVGQLGLERPAVGRPDPRRAGERTRIRLESASLVPDLLRELEDVLVVQHVVRVRREVDAAVDEHRGGRVLEAELALVGRPGTELRVLGLEDTGTSVSGTVTVISSICSTATSSSRDSVAPREPCMK